MWFYIYNVPDFRCDGVNRKQLSQKTKKTIIYFQTYFQLIP